CSATTLTSPYPAFFFHDTPTTATYTLSLHDALPISALAFTDEIVKLKKPTDVTFKAIAAKLTPAALIELQLSVGFYIMTSKFLRSEEHTSELQSRENLVCRLLLEKKKTKDNEYLTIR